MYGGEAEEQTTLVLVLASVLGGLSGGILGGFIAYHLVGVGHLPLQLV